MIPQPIETGPHDGTHILAANLNQANPIWTAVHWFDERWYLSVNELELHAGWQCDRLTHWLPQPPTSLERPPSEPQASVREVLKGENMSLMRDYYQDKPVAAISYNPFTDSQLRTISHWLKCQKDYFEKLAKEHPNEIQYQGMASAASMIKDKWELEQFEKRLDNA